MLSIIILILVPVLLSATINAIDLIGNANERKAMEKYCKIECKSYKKLVSYK